MELFQIKDNHVEPTPECLLIPEFGKIWESDTSEAKVKARAAFAYIYHGSSPKSNYRNDRDRENTVRRDFLKSKAPDKIVLAAVTKFLILIDTAEKRLLDGALSAADKLAAYLGNVNFTEVDVKGNLVHEPTKIMGILKSVKDVYASLIALRVLAEKGEEEREGNRADAELNMFDDNE